MPWIPISDGFYSCLEAAKIAGGWNIIAKIPVDKDRIERFEQVILPHLNAAYNLARWLTRNEHDAEDVVQEAYLRALHSFHSFQSGRDGRAWLLQIVRNTSYTLLRKNRAPEAAAELADGRKETFDTRPDPETALLEKLSSEGVQKALEELPPEYREIIILREFEDFSYAEMAQILELPVGTVMSRLSRARSKLRDQLREGRQERTP